MLKLTWSERGDCTPHVTVYGMFCVLVHAENLVATVDEKFPKNNPVLKKKRDRIPDRKTG